MIGRRRRAFGLLLLAAFGALGGWAALVAIWQPFLLGCLVVGTISALLGFLSIRLLWRYHIFQHLRHRKTRVKNGNEKNQADA